MRRRRSGDMARHSGKAALAAATAVSTSSGPLSMTVPFTRAVEGLMWSIAPSDARSSHVPLISGPVTPRSCDMDWGTVMGVSPCFLFRGGRARLSQPRYPAAIDIDDLAVDPCAGRGGQQEQRT